MDNVYIESKCFEEDCVNVWLCSNGHYCYTDSPNEDDRLYITLNNKEKIDKCNRCNIRFENM